MNSSKKIHFIAIGGAVMHNLALALQKKGYTITGSDDEIYDPSKSRLQAAGILPEFIGWNPDAIHKDLDAIVLGMHAREDNPELKKALDLGIKIYSFPEYVYEQSKNKQRVVIAGSHGKTSITSMILHVLNYHKKNVDYLVGAQIEGFDLMVQLSEDAPVILIEGDEYFNSALDKRSKFLIYEPHIALISGIAWDHFNVFPKYEDYVKTFEQLADGLPKAGSLIYDETDDVLKVIGDKEREDVNRLPYTAHPYEIINGRAELKTGKKNIPLRVFGEHNMKNLMGAKLVCERLAITDEQFYEAIATFGGAAKRLEKVVENDVTVVYRDFAHAPSKVKATTNALAELFPQRALIACYELHTYSSLNKDFLPQYADTLKKADKAVAFYSPKTLEIKKREPIAPEEIKKAFKREDLLVFTSKEELENWLKEQNWYHTNLLLMSSGTFGGTDFKALGEKLLQLPVERVMPKLNITKGKEDSSWGGLLKRIRKD